MTTELPRAVGAPLERQVRPLVDKLRDCAQGMDLGADGMGWSPDPALLREAADELEDRSEALEDWKNRWRHERTHGCPHWGNNTSDGRDRVCWYGDPQATQDEARALARKLGAVIGWLEANQPDVFKRGLHDAVRAA